MVRRRTAVSLSAAAALLAASPVITACGTPHAGAAAVVGDETISVSALQANVNEVRAAQEQSPQATQLIEGTGRLTSEMLGNMVTERVLDKAAADAGITVTQADVDKERSLYEHQFGGTAALQAKLLANDVAPGQTNRFFRTRITIQRLIQSLGYQPGSDPGNAALSAQFARTSKAMGVDVNPRFGHWDAQSGTLGTLNEPWLAKAPNA